ncbi:MAG: beta-lactamase family protein [Anaerolineae bacterium]|nr:beta-lactamase family protein [Anaerolineae bacterium]
MTTKNENKEENMQVIAPELVGMSAERLKNIGTKLQQYVDAERAAGFVTLVARDSEIVHFEACGYRDAEQRLPMELDTIFRIYSMTKPITSIALMMLHEQGKFQLVEPVSRYIPAFGNTKVLAGYGYMGPQLASQNPPMTIHHLLTHTAGLSYGFFFDSPIDEMYRDSIFRSETASLEEKIVGMAELPLRFQPGSAWNYSIATDVCGYLVQLLADMPFEDFLAERIFEPLGMVDTAFHVSADKLDRFATLYRHDAQTGGFSEYEGAPHIPWHDYSKPASAPSGGGGLVSTMSDYWQFANMLLNEGELYDTRIIGRKTLEFMTRNHISKELLPMAIGLATISGRGFGLGFDVVMDAPQTGVINSEGNYGWSGAAATNFWVDPQEQLVGIIMTQLMDNMLLFQQDFRALTYQALVD